MKNLYLLFFIFSYCLSANGQGGFYITNYHNEIEIKSGGQLLVTENISVVFTEKRRGIFRNIRRKGTFNNHVQSITIDDVDVEDHPFKVSKKRGQYEIRIGDKNTYLEGPQQYTIQYTVHNAILNFEAHEELFWTLIATEWEAPIQKSSYAITLPTDLDITTEDVVVYNGQQHALTNHASVYTEPGKIYGESLKILGEGAGMTIGVRMPKGYVYSEGAGLAEKVVPPTPKPKDSIWLIPLSLILGLIWSFQKWGRNRQVYTQTANKAREKYYPPQGMTAAEVGTFYDYRVNVRDVTSMLPTWGHKGKIIMGVDSEYEHSGLFIQKIQDLDGDEPEYEQYFFDVLFKDGDYVKVNSLNNSFYTDFAKIKSLLKVHTLKDEYYDQQSKGIFQSIWIILIGVFFILLGIASCIAFHWWATGAGCIVLGIACFVIRFLEPKKSAMGKALHDQLEIFKAAISDPEDREIYNIAISDPRYFESIFPYVVAFGIDKEWLNKFKNIFTKPPEWFHSQGAPYILFDDFRRDFKMNTIEQKISTPPIADSSSSSFGGSGGGVGGGFGGGGGGSW